MIKTKIIQNSEEQKQYYIDKRLEKTINKTIIPSLMKNDKDYVIAIDGKEGSGKSTLALQIGKCVDPTLDLSRVVFDAESFKEAIYKAKKGQVVIFDEAFTGLSSRSALSPVNKALISLMMQMRQKNLMVIIVLPTFFLLEKYVALFRTRFLIHVYENKGRRGYFRVYNSKKKKYLYLFGKKTLSYGSKKDKHFVYTRFKGKFYGKFALGDSSVEKKYRKKKEKALIESEKNPMTSGQIKYREQRDLLLFLLRKSSKMKYAELSNLLGDYDFSLSIAQIGQICSRFGENIKTEAKEDILEKHIEDNDNLANEQIINSKIIDEEDFSNSKVTIHTSNL